MDGIKVRNRLKILSDAQVDAIEEASFKILEKTGVRFDSEQARMRLIKAGAVAHPSRKNVITFPRSLVKETVKHIKPWGTYHARDPKHDEVFDGETMYAHSLGGNPGIFDLDTGVYRMSTLEDVEKTTLVMDALENCHSISNLVVATDVPPELLVVKSQEAMMKNTSKCVSGYALNVECVDILAKMWSCVTGGLEELRKRPLLDVYGSPSSPLTYDTHVCDVIVRGAEYGVPVDLVPCPIAGGTAPITIAGGLAQQNAEVLAGIALVQTVTDKVPIMYSGRLSMMDLRTGRNVWGMPEMALASAATVQLAHKYKMIADVYGVTMDGHCYDLQAGVERAQCALIPALAGADCLSGIGGAWENGASYEMLPIDNEIYSDVFRAVRGFDVDDDILAVEVVDKVGSMGNFLGSAHTMKYLKKGEIRLSNLWDKRTGERAKQEGVRPVHERAREVVKVILKEHRPTPLEPDVERQLSQVVKEAEKSLLRRS